jgi:hypothetical protein
MTELRERRPECKADHGHVDADNLAVLTLTRKFGLTRSTALLIAELSGVGACEDRRSTSGGRA